MITVRLTLNPKLYLRDPQQTQLGQRILQHSIQLIDEIGFEQFTFKKLAERIQSTEASIYRYFENKHQLLVYMLNWYWEWMKFRIDYQTMNISDPRERLRIALRTVVDTTRRNTTIEFVDEDLLHQIVLREGAKTYHTKSVDEENKEGYFLSYKSLCKKIADLILEINPRFPYPRTLASTLVEMANNNLYFARHLPRLTDLPNTESLHDEATRMLEYFAFRLLAKTELPAYSNGKKIEFPKDSVDMPMS